MLTKREKGCYIPFPGRYNYKALYATQAIRVAFYM